MANNHELGWDNELRIGLMEIDFEKLDRELRSRMKIRKRQLNYMMREFYRRHPHYRHDPNWRVKSNLQAQEK